LKVGRAHGHPLEQELVYGDRVTIAYDVTSVRKTEGPLNRDVPLPTRDELDCVIAWPLVQHVSGLVQSIM